jgi:hypothetical protein
VANSRSKPRIFQFVFTFHRFPLLHFVPRDCLPTAKSWSRDRDLVAGLAGLGQCRASPQPLVKSWSRDRDLSARLAELGRCQASPQPAPAPPVAKAGLMAPRDTLGHGGSWGDAQHRPNPRGQAPRHSPCGQAPGPGLSRGVAPWWPSHGPRGQPRG